MNPSYEFLNGYTEMPWSGYWLGLYKSLETNSWRWIDDTPLIYVEWAISQPNGGFDYFVFDFYDLSQKKHKGWHDWKMLGNSLVLCELKC